MNRFDVYGQVFLFLIILRLKNPQKWPFKQIKRLVQILHIEFFKYDIIIIYFILPLRLEAAIIYFLKRSYPSIFQILIFIPLKLFLCFPYFIKHAVVEGVIWVLDKNYVKLVSVWCKIYFHFIKTCILNYFYITIFFIEIKVGQI